MTRAIVIHERPIIMSAPMIRALIDGRKTQTRRLIADDQLWVTLPREVRGDWPLGDHHVAKPGRYRAKLNRAGAVTIATDPARPLEYDLGVKPGEFHFVCPYAAGSTVLADYGTSGAGWRTKWTVLPRPSRLWVRETWCRGSDEDASEYARDHLRVDISDRPRGPVYPGCDYPAFAYYAATDPDIVNSNDEDRSPWKSPIHMPRWACRLELDVIHARIERLQDLSEEDAIAEGARRFDDIHDVNFYGQGNRWSMESPTSTDQCLGTARFAVGNLWTKLHGERAWDANPWVWVVEFCARVITPPAAIPRDPAEFPLDTVHAADGLRHREAIA